MTTVLVTGAGGAAGANFIDALRRADDDYTVVGTDVTAEFLHLSRADERILVPRPVDDGYIAALNSAASRFNVDLIHPQPDPEVIVIGRLRADLQAPVFLPTQDALELAADKAGARDALAHAHVPVPDGTTFDRLEDAGDAIEPLFGGAGRVWIRARRGAGARASLPVTKTDQAVAWMRWWIDEKGMAASDFMATEFLPGRELAYQSVWQDGELVTGQLRERLSYLHGHLTPSGQTSSPSIARTVDIPVADDSAIAAVRALDDRPQGVYCVDMKESEDGVAKITEINAGRFFTTSNFFAAAGLNMPDIYVRCALGEHPKPTGSSPLPAGLHWVRMMDMGYALVAEDELDRWPRADH